MSKRTCNLIFVVLIFLLYGGCIKQEDVFYIKSNPTEIYMNQEGGTDTVWVTGNTNWEVVIPESWCTTNLSCAEVSYYPIPLVFTVEKNNENKERKQKIVLQSSVVDNIRTTVTVIQQAVDEPEEPEEPIPTDSLLIQPESLEIGCKGGVYEVVLYSNTEWTYEGSSEPWCVLELDEVWGKPGAHVLSVVADTTKRNEERAAVLSFKTAKDSVVTFSVKQRKVGISIVEDLIAFRDDVNAGAELDPWMDADSTVHLRADLDLSSVSNWVPIGLRSQDGSVKSIKGVFAGNGYGISNLTIVHSALPSVGLFGHVQDAIIQNLTLDESCSITLHSSDNRELSTGGLCGTLEGGTLFDCHFRGTVKVTGGNAYAATGGMVGTLCVYEYIELITLKSKPSDVAGCSNSGMVEGGVATGGLVGELKGTVRTGHLVRHSENKAGSRVTGTSSVGGICGVLFLNNTVEHCANKGDVKAREDKAGGICGEQYGSSSIILCVNENGAFVQGGSHIGGICGYSMSHSTITECTNHANVTGRAEVGGICGTQTETASIKKCSNTGHIISQKTEEQESNGTGGIAGISYASDITDSENKGRVTGLHSVGGITGYFGTTAGGYANLEKCSNTAVVEGEDLVGGIVGMVYSLTSTLFYLSDLTNSGPVTATAFSGVAGGIAGTLLGTLTIEDCKNLKGADVDTPEGTAGGIAGSAPERGVQLIRCENHANITSGKWAAGIVAHSSDKISRCLNTGNVTVVSDKESSRINEYLLLAGGIVAKSSRSVELCENKGHITGFNAAGIATHFTATTSAYGIKDCTNSGEILGSNTAGGIAGYMDNGAYIKGAENIGPVTGAHRVGGIVAINKDGELEFCTNSGPVSGTEMELSDSYFAMGGICANNHGGNLTACKNLGPITRVSQTGQYKFVGGVLGATEGNNYNRGVLKDCSNSGDVTGIQDAWNACYTGGFCGFFRSGPEPENCTNTGNVNGEPANSENEYGGTA
ncbi:MAG: BACON domain-containing protein [Bacteroidales bacterium]|nr:BACON domain-containing protein [Bacteroidales bacterium]